MNRFKGNVGDTSARQGGTRMGFLIGYHLELNWTVHKLLYTSQTFSFFDSFPDDCSYKVQDICKEIIVSIDFLITNNSTDTETRRQVLLKISMGYVKYSEKERKQKRQTLSVSRAESLECRESLTQPVPSPLTRSVSSVSSHAARQSPTFSPASSQTAVYQKDS